MTVIAYKDGVLAGDTALWIKDVKIGDTVKVVKTKRGQLVGSAGDAVAAQKFRNWALDGFTPKWTCEDSFQGILVERDGTIILYDSGSPYVYSADFYAIGCGYELALGAMRAGATAEEAVKIAIEYSAKCGGDVVSVRLTSKPSIRQEKRRS